MPRHHRGPDGRRGAEPDRRRQAFQRRLLVESVLLPSRQVAEQFRTTVITTRQGVTVSGLVVGETADAVELLLSDTTRKEVRKKDVEERKISNLSPMPAGLVKKPEELRDLLGVPAGREAAAAVRPYLAFTRIVLGIMLGVSDSHRACFPSQPRRSAANERTHYAVPGDRLPLPRQRRQPMAENTLQFEWISQSRAAGPPLRRRARRVRRRRPVLVPGGGPP